MNFSRSRSLLSLGVFLSVGCGGPASPPDTGPTAVDGGTDAATLVDAAHLDAAHDIDAFVEDDASGPTDAGPRHDAPVVLADGGSSASDVARCESIGAMLATACDGQADRTCEQTQIAMFCGRERAALLADGFQCLLDESMGSCRTFSDPSGARPCMMALAAANDITHASAVGHAFAAVCPTTDPDQIVVQSILPLMMLSDATLDRMTSCIAGIHDCNGAIACFFDEFSSVAACYP